MINIGRSLHFWSIFIVLLSMVFGGCARQILQPDYTLYKKSTFTADTVESLATFYSVSGLAKIKIKVGNKDFSGDHALFAETPNKIRAELLGLFGQPLYLLVSDGESITYLIPGENRYFKSLSSAENFYRLTHIPLDGDAFVGLLLGRLPSIGKTEFHAEIDVDGNHVVTLSGTKDQYQELRFNQHRQLVVGRLWLGDHLLLTVKYSDFTDAGFATTIRLNFPDSKVSASIEFDEPAVDHEIPVQRFELAIPEGANRIDLNRS